MMTIKSILLITSLFIAWVSAIPVHVHEHANAFLKRDGSLVDKRVIIFASLLEDLEAFFYIQALERFSESDFLHAGLPSGTYKIFQEIRDHEIIHVEVLKAILGHSAVPSCEYDFGYKDVRGFLAVARALENTGVSAYDGAVAGIANKTILTAAATIATIEARHSAFINYISAHLPVPHPFDTPLNMRQIVTIAAVFIKSCPFDIGIKPFPVLILEPSSDSAGSLVKVSFKAAHGSSTHNLHCAFLFGANFTSSPLVEGKCRIPKDIEGDVYIFVTSNAKKPVDENTVAGPTIFFAGN